MALTRCFKDLVQTRTMHDPAFGDALREGIDTMLTGFDLPPGEGEEKSHER